MGLIMVISLVIQTNIAAAETEDLTVRKVMIPGTDHFVPFALSIKVGDTVQWTNNDTDDHTIVSDDAYTTPSFRGINKLIPGTDSNGGKPGMFSLRFRHPGTFIYYCRFHAKLDANNQPVAPGPKGGIQDSTGNYGTPMMGVITVR
ncbi:MAG: cupredoxin domain-containing protein [Bdellovibrio sp.]